MAEHKHAAVLRAIADGKAVQWRLNSTWNDYVDGHPGCPLYCMDCTEWRIKPEPKPDVVRYWPVNACGGLRSPQEAREYFPGAQAIIKITFDAEKGQYSAEVLP